MKKSNEIDIIKISATDFFIALVFDFKKNNKNIENNINKA